MTQRNFEGSKYQSTKDLSIREIAALIRKDLKKYPTKDGYKFSVRSDIFSGGQSIAVTIRSIPEGITVETPEFVAWREQNPHSSYLSAPQRYSNELTALMDDVKDIVNAYNFDDSDSSSDYFHSNFYDSIRLDLEVREGAA
jgi:hypothetical protein